MKPTACPYRSSNGCDSKPQALIKLAQLSGDFGLQNPLIRFRLIQHLGQGVEGSAPASLENAGVAFGFLRQASLALRHADTRT